MSGTSADGINVALVRIGEGTLAHAQRCARLPAVADRSVRATRSNLLGHAEYSYPAKVRAAVLAAMNATSVSVADLARLNFLLGELYADAVLATQRRFRVKADLVGCHGQTLYHQGEPQLFLGRKVAATWQTGEAAVIAARVGVPVVSDFRPADMAAGGKGAPLVPYLDYLLFRRSENRAHCAEHWRDREPHGDSCRGRCAWCIAFDTGPGNMVIDAVTEKLFGRRVRSRGQDRGVRSGDRVGARNSFCRINFFGRSRRRRRDARNLGGNLWRISCDGAGERANKT